MRRKLLNFMSWSPARVPISSTRGHSSCLLDCIMNCVSVGALPWLFMFQFLPPVCNDLIHVCPFKSVCFCQMLQSLAHCCVALCFPLVIIIFTSVFRAWYWWFEHIVCTYKAHASVVGSCYTFLWNSWTTNLGEMELKHEFKGILNQLVITDNNVNYFYCSDKNLLSR